MHIAIMRTRTVTIRDLPHAALETLRARALANHRSLNGELLSLIESAVGAERSRPAGRVRETAAPPFGPAIDRAVLAAACRRHHIRWLAMFGSTARGEAGPQSDVDLVADFEPGMTPGLGIIRVAEALRPAFGGRPVDLVTRRGLSPRFRDRVLAEAVPLHGA